MYAWLSVVGFCIRSSGAQLVGLSTSSTCARAAAAGVTYAWLGMVGFSIKVQWGTVGGLEHKQHLCACSSSRGYVRMVGHGRLQHKVQWGTVGGLERKQHLRACSSSRGYGTLVMYHWLCIGLARTVHIYTVYDRIFGDSPAKNTAYKPYLYGSGQP